MLKLRLVNRDKANHLKINVIWQIIKLGRLKFLIGGFILFSFGSLLALLSNAKFILQKFLLGYAILFMAQLSVSYSNDYFDVDVDRYNIPTAFSGGSGILQENPELREFARWFAITLMGISVILGIIFTVLFSYSVLFLIFVIFGNLLGWYYTAPPLKLVYRRYSEIVTVIINLIIPAMGYFVLKGGFDTLFLIFILPLTLYGVDFIVNVEIPDMEGDRIGNKNTLVVRRGRRFSFIVIAFSLFLTTLYFLILSAINLSPILIDFRLITLFSLLPLSLGFLGLVKRSIDRDLATRLVGSNLLSLYSLLLMTDCYLIILLN